MGATDEQVASYCLFSVSTAKRIRASLEECGTPAPPSTTRRGRPPTLNAEQRAALIIILTDKPSLTLSQMQERLAEQGIYCPISTLSDTVHELRFTRKKLTKEAAERDPVLCDAYARFMGSFFISSQVVYVDETTWNKQLCYPDYGYAPEGERAVEEQPAGRGTRLSLLAAITRDGFLTGQFCEGSWRSGTFLQWVVSELLQLTNPYLSPNSVIVLDNCSIHKMDDLYDIVRAMVKADLAREGGDVLEADDTEEAVLDLCRLRSYPDAAVGLYKSAGWRW
ncbi:hypothetical protein JCM11641_002103 [Rhodosporidiobolus odoratus]